MQRQNRTYGYFSGNRWNNLAGDVTDEIAMNPAHFATRTPEAVVSTLVHEMVHLLEPTHNSRFIAMMDKFMPNWRLRREYLNQLPVRHEEWEY